MKVDDERIRAKLGQSDISKVLEVDDTCPFCMDILKTILA